MNYLVYTGNLYPHKNVNIAIAAAEKLKIPLKIICARSVFEKKIIKSDYVEFLGRLTDTEMKKVYKEALAFVFPSLIEGFGLPGLEAMSVGLPVVAANSSCLPEVYEDAALFFDPFNVDDLVAKISLIRDNKAKRAELIKKGFSQVKKYSWSKMSAQTWDIYKKFC